MTDAPETQDIVERLGSIKVLHGRGVGAPQEAAEEITALRAEISILKFRLDEFDTADAAECDAYNNLRDTNARLREQMSIAFLIISEADSVTDQTAERWLTRYMDAEFNADRIEGQAALQEGDQSET